MDGSRWMRVCSFIVQHIHRILGLQVHTGRSISGAAHSSPRAVIKGFGAMCHTNLTAVLKSKPLQSPRVF